MTHDFFAQYEHIIDGLEEAVRNERFTPSAIPALVRGVKDEIRDLINFPGGSRFTEAQARHLMHRLNSITHSQKAA